MKLGIDGSEPEWCEIGGDINVEFIDPAGFPHGLLPRDECLQLFHQLLHLAIDIYNKIKYEVLEYYKR